MTTEDKLDLLNLVVARQKAHEEAALALTHRDQFGADRLLELTAAPVLLDDQLLAALCEARAAEDLNAQEALALSSFV